MLTIPFEILGYGTWWFGHKQAEKIVPWYIELPAAVGGAFAANRFNLGTRAAAVRTGRAVWGLTGRLAGSTGRWALRTRAGVAARGATFAIASYTSAVTAGYMIGAVAGTGISQAIWGDRGARHAVDFYTGKGKYGEYFDIVGNTQTIYNVLRQGDI